MSKKWRTCCDTHRGEYYDHLDTCPLYGKALMVEMVPDDPADLAYYREGGIRTCSHCTRQIFRGGLCHQCASQRLSVLNKKRKVVIQQKWLAANPWYKDLPVYQEGDEVRCPTHERHGVPIAPEDTPGCGSADVSFDGEVYDCNACGIFFSPFAADPPHRRES